MLYKKIIIIFSLLACTSIAFMSLRYFNFDIHGVLQLHPDELVKQLWYKVFFYVHVAGGILALITAPWQLMKRRKWHKKLGKIYFFGAVAGGVAGMVIGATAFGGIIAKVGFLLSALLWVYFTILGVQAIRKGNIMSHRKWSLRSVAMTFLAVSFRIILLAYPIFGMSFQQGYQMAAWSWLINLFIVEFYLLFKAYGTSQKQHLA